MELESANSWAVSAVGTGTESAEDRSESCQQDASASAIDDVKRGHGDGLYGMPVTTSEHDDTRESGVREQKCCRVAVRDDAD
ncbi:hypothetical protein CQ031_16915 [Microbacterium sp. MYb40]|nr:hypothetical protein CQ031_16915 [Microbacterium sp. MYb40]PRB73955.1 hypothetical protein CQ027_10920 [Microbacterium sp. MYb32]